MGEQRSLWSYVPFILADILWVREANMYVYLSSLYDEFLFLHKSPVLMMFNI